MSATWTSSLSSPPARRGSKAPNEPGACPPGPVMKPAIHGVRTRWIRGFMAFQLARRTRTVLLMVLM
jgi:hypothetical protein